MTAHTHAEPMCWNKDHDPALCPCAEVICTECGEYYPCPTIRALTQEDS